MKRWFLSVSTFIGFAPGASHFYGRMRREDGSLREEVSIEKKNGNTGYASERALRKAAVSLFRKKATEEDVLICGSFCVIDPREIIAGPKKLRQEANKIWKKFELENGWDSPKDRWPEIEKICEEWNRLFAPPPK